jgi:hypothetical protein
MATFPWVFQQLGGDRRKLTLDKRDAPHGRPRQKPVVEETLKIRQAVTRYAGNRVPTRHIFGEMFDDFDIAGRFTNSFGGVNYAVDKRDFVKGFVADQQEVRISWGNLLSMRGLILEAKFGIESAGEIAYHLTVGVNDDELVDTSRDAGEPDPRTPKQFATEMAILLQNPIKSPDLPSMKGSVFDLLDTLVAGVNSATAAVLGIADQIEGFEKALVGDIRRFRAGLGQLKTAMLKLQRTYDLLTTDVALQTNAASEEMKFWSGQTATSLSVQNALFVLAQADRQARIAERGKIQALYEAKSGDTWERISLAIYGSPDRANDIRDANGIPSGSFPVAGVTYVVPV